jgi:hypothetical protein
MSCAYQHWKVAAGGFTARAKVHPIYQPPLMLSRHSFTSIGTNKTAFIFPMNSRYKNLTALPPHRHQLLKAGPPNYFLPVMTVDVDVNL